MVFRLRSGLDANLLFVVQESLAGGEQHVVHSRFHHFGERSVAFHAELFVRAVVAHEIHLCVGQFISFHLIHPSRDGLYYLRFLKAVDMVPAASVASV